MPASHPSPAGHPQAHNAPDRRDVYDAEMEGVRKGSMEAKLDALGEKVDELGWRIGRLESRFDHFQLAVVVGMLGIIGTLIGFN